MSKAISIRWLPINSKAAYKFYLEADKLALGTFAKKERTVILRITDVLGATRIIWRYQRLLRKVEYYHNCKTSFFYKPYKAYLLFRLERLGLRLGFQIPLNVFGPGLSIAHYGTIIVNRDACVGANCTLMNLVHIANKTARTPSPKIGDNVYIGPGARLLGDITVADGTVVGANSVVTKSICEPNTTVAGVPAHKIGDRGTESYWRPGQRDVLISYVTAHEDQFAGK
jgi:serine O-acetyltransferase